VLGPFFFITNAGLSHEPGRWGRRYYICGMSYRENDAKMGFILVGLGVVGYGLWLAGKWLIHLL
jgi:hypothetical protein